jgi:predicted GH43/DUF377 family glycosyl hydrolase
LSVLAPTNIRLTPRCERVVAKPFIAHTAGVIDQTQRLRQIVERVCEQTSPTPEEALHELRARFGHRHRNLEELWRRHFDEVSSLLPELQAIRNEQWRLLLGASFTQEYALEGAALTNPSAVPVGEGNFILSLRAIGEGHISSIEFRTGRLSSDGTVSIDDPGVYARPGSRSELIHDRKSFATKLAEMDAEDEIADMVLDLLPEQFNMDELLAAVARVASKDRVHPRQAETTFHMFHWLASSNYELTFGQEPLAERVLFPAGPADSRGMEDARFVRFIDDDAIVRFYATYTAFDGFRILPQLISTNDFARFTISTLHGKCAQNKGMALFPRPFSGQYAALGRHDQTNLHLLWSDDLWHWNNTERLAGPAELWESIQIGNCGSPIETPAGWLVITHGVGPMRTYSLGALLLDLAEPSKVIGRLRQPLLQPDESERDGYVPNVVYSCGGFVEGPTLIVPYGVGDQEVRIGLANLDELLTAMV